MTMVFVAMFTMIFLSLTGLATRQYHQTVLQAHRELAFQVAEAGLNYARWRLAHSPTNFAPETKNVTDQFAGVIGSYQLTFTAPTSGSTIVLINSVGTTASQPGTAVTVQARYGIPSLARYSYIVNSDVYFASTMSGPFHANGGIRMDGQSNSIVSSAKETYACQPYHGCNPAQTKPGIWGVGQDQNLWEFPVTPVDYTGLTVDLNNIKTTAQASGTYYGPSGTFGYQLVLNNDTTYTVFLVTQITPAVRSCDYATANPNSWSCSCLSHDIQTPVLVETRPVPANGVIYFEDKVWVAGSLEANEKVTVAAGVFPDQPSTNADIIINGSITYNGVFDGSRVFGAIAQRHMLIPWSGAPATLRLDGAYIAQKGKFGRRHYPPGSSSCPASNAAHRLKTKIDTFGMIASYLVPGTTWTSGGAVVSGYQQKTQSYDPNLLYAPPPYFPTDGQYEFISWEEVE